jgi:antitoxin PrlF
MATRGKPTVVRTTVRAKSQLTLPVQVREALRVGEDDQLEFTIDEHGTVTVRGWTAIPADQAWFWTPEWQAGEREADADIAAGRGTVHHSVEEFLGALEDRAQG